MKTAQENILDSYFAKLNKVAQKAGGTGTQDDSTGELTTAYGNLAFLSKLIDDMKNYEDLCDTSAAYLEHVPPTKDSLAGLQQTYNALKPFHQFLRSKTGAAAAIQNTMNALASAIARIESGK